MAKIILLLAIVLCAICVISADDRRKCEPSSAFMIECNRCRCNADGTHFWCTRMACVDFPRSRRQTAAEEPRAADPKPEERKPEEHAVNGQVCTPGDVKHEDCNRCRCANNGIGWWCTRNECPSRRKRHPRIP
ncbi:serine protease inhibitor I/II-like [Phlebotomus argentipes]|uniref:serine protease inhibitor I/II-like n=1 Tax=Phlebotomus argentipes TaxID=94469 RepID=UPI002892DC75|nr:serine protease inhibitor I/II-like [Phlebotomus argentipes]